jgi:hypothetical protein
MDEFENAPLTPPQPEPNRARENGPASDSPLISDALQTEDFVAIQAGQTPELLRTPDSPSSPDSPPDPDSLPARDSAEAVRAFQQVTQLGARPAAPPVATPRPRDPITPKPRAIFITAALLVITLIIWFAGNRAGWFAPDPLDVARAQLLDLNQGRWRAAYDLFSPRYRGAVSFETWHEMALMHSRMFRTREMRFDDNQEWNGGAALDAHLVGESGDRYLARFTLVYAEGHWWVDDLHWGRERTPPGQIKV